MDNQIKFQCVCEMYVRMECCFSTFGWNLISFAFSSASVLVHICVLFSLPLLLFSLALCMLYTLHLSQTPLSSHMHVCQRVHFLFYFLFVLPIFFRSTSTQIDTNNTLTNAQTLCHIGDVVAFASHWLPHTWFPDEHLILAICWFPCCWRFVLLLRCVLCHAQVSHTLPLISIGYAYASFRHQLCSLRICFVIQLTGNPCNSSCSLLLSAYSSYGCIEIGVNAFAFEKLILICINLFVTCHVQLGFQ